MSFVTGVDKRLLRCSSALGWLASCCVSLNIFLRTLLALFMHCFWGYTTCYTAALVNLTNQVNFRRSSRAVFADFALTKFTFLHVCVSAVYLKFIEIFRCVRHMLWLCRFPIALRIYHPDLLKIIAHKFFKKIVSISCICYLWYRLFMTVCRDTLLGPCRSCRDSLIAVATECYLMITSWIKTAFEKALLELLYF